MALGHALLGAQETERLGQILQPADEQVAAAFEERPVRRWPVLSVPEQVAELEDRAIGDAAIREQLLDSFVGRFRPGVGPYAGPVRPDADIGHGADPLGDQEPEELIGPTAAVADGVEGHRPIPEPGGSCLAWKASSPGWHAPISAHEPHYFFADPSEQH